MSSRLDRLVTLLETGQTAEVRSHAARQLGDIAKKFFSPDATGGTEDARQSNKAHIPRLEDGWDEAAGLVARILPFVRSKAMDTRTAAVEALNYIAQATPSWDPNTAPAGPSEGIPPPPRTSRRFSVQDVLNSGSTLVASAGTEFKGDGKKRSKEEQRKAQAALLDSIGVKNMDSRDLIDDEDMEVDGGTVKREVKEEELEDQIGGRPRKRLKMSSPEKVVKMEVAPAPKDVFEGLSGRQIMVLKRKRKSGMGEEELAEEAMRMRLGVGPSTTPRAEKMEPVAMNSTIKDLASVKMENNREDNRDARPSSRGGAVLAGQSGGDQEIARTNTGQWPWKPFVDELAPYLHDSAWESRHGSALALSRILRHQGHSYGMISQSPDPDNGRLHEQAMLVLAYQALRTMILDRFADHGGDQIVAPVREATSQMIASLLKHMSEETVLTIHAIFLDMIFQDWSKAKGRSYSWEVRHAGLLGLKFEVALRKDLFGHSDKVHSSFAISTDQAARLEEVVVAASSGLGDADDDVRSVSASCLVPIAGVLGEKLPEDQLIQLLDGLWQCFLVDGDELGSSIASVMELLGELLTVPRVIEFYAQDNSENSHLGDLIPRLYPFFRHPIVQVRLILAKTVKIFLGDPSLPKAWVDARIFHLLYENLILEEREQVRQSTAQAWTTALQLAPHSSDLLGRHVLPNLAGWLEIAMTPIAHGLDRSLFQGGRPAKDNDGIDISLDIDKPVLASDLSLVSEELLLRNRLSAVRALAEVSRFDLSSATHMTLMAGVVQSNSAHQLFLGAVFVEEWAMIRQRFVEGGSSPMSAAVPACEPIGVALMALLDRSPEEDYYETKPQALALLRESEALKQIFEKDLGGKKRHVDLGIDLSAVSGAQDLVGSKYDELSAKLSASVRARIGESLGERKRLIETIIRSYRRLKETLDNRVLASAAAAVIAMRIVPPKLNPVIQSIMRSVKGEAYSELQLRSAQALASFMAACLDPLSGLPSGPPVKIVSNLANFLCQDESYTPQLVRFPQRDGILSLIISDSAKALETQEPTDEISAGLLIRKGAQFALKAIVERLGPHVLERLPKLWQVMTESLTTTLDRDENATISQDKVQNVVDAMTILETIAPLLDSQLGPQLATALPFIARASRTEWAVTRKAAATCFAAVCAVLPEAGVKILLNQVIPSLGDLNNLHYRQGGIEILNLVVRRLDLAVLPYVLFLIVPILGRMTDPDQEVRSMATNTFATLIKMVPLEEGIPEAGLTDEENAKRQSEREFLKQLMNPKKAAPYSLAVPIDAELRPYQKEGVSWLAFLANYQLHGILCDDMGLGKSLQAICIMASKHEERRLAFAKSKSPEHKPLLSLIVCPPTLVGHWFNEIPKFCSNLKPLRYFGNAGQREDIRRHFASHNVIVTSYEVVRADIGILQKHDFLYCVLDEGHVIKNGKSKLSLAIKCLKATHRLVLSGTPIQNAPVELWSLFDFLMPGYLGTERQFNERFSRAILANRDGKATAKQKEAATLALEALHKQVLPFLMRRLKEEVLHDLPPKIVQDYECGLSAVQQKLYEDFAQSQSAKDSEAAIVKENIGAGQQHVFQSLQYLRKLCNHPMLVLGEDVGRMREIIKRVSVGRDPEEVPKDILDLRHAPKLLALKQILQDCGIGAETSETATGDLDSLGAISRHRVLIFCQSRNMLDIIQKVLFRKMTGVSHMRLDGGTSALDRHDVAQKFNNDPSVDVLLLTTSVGGLGLTLTGADTVVFVDHDWNPMKDLQAMDRAHRIGQKKVVNVYRLITKGTLEEKIMGLQRFKLNIANSVVTQQNSGLATMDTGQVLDLFTASADDTAQSRKSKGGDRSKVDSLVDGKIGSAVLAGLEDLPPEDEYSNLSLDAFLSQM